MYASIMIRLSPTLKYQLAIDIHVISTRVASAAWAGRASALESAMADTATAWAIFIIFFSSFGMGANILRPNRTAARREVRCLHANPNRSGRPHHRDGRNFRQALRRHQGRAHLQGNAPARDPRAGARDLAARGGHPPA